MSPDNGLTVPQDERSKLDFAGRFVRALVSIKNAVDADNHNAFGTRWKPAELGRPPYEKTLVVIRFLELVVR